MESLSFMTRRMSTVSGRKRESHTANPPADSSSSWIAGRISQTGIEVFFAYLKRENKARKEPERKYSGFCYLL